MCMFNLWEEGRDTVLTLYMYIMYIIYVCVYLSIVGCMQSPVPLQCCHNPVFFASSLKDVLSVVCSVPQSGTMPYYDYDL